VFIDFDAAAPGARVDDLAYLAWTFCALGDPARTPTAQAHRLRLLADAYAACTGRRLHAEVVGALSTQQNKVRSWRDNQAHTATDPELRAPAGRRVTEIDDQMRWMQDHNDVFASALG
jgi:aminoglycoside phosphotransferase (APT) family kinase protein